MSASNTTSTISVPVLFPVSRMLLLAPADGLLEVLRDLFKFGSVISILDRFDLSGFDATIESASILVSDCAAVLLRSAIRSFTSPPRAWKTGIHSAKSLESMSFRSTAIIATMVRAFSRREGATEEDGCFAIAVYTTASSALTVERLKSDSECPVEEGSKYSGNKLMIMRGGGREKGIRSMRNEERRDVR